MKIVKKSVTSNVHATIMFHLTWLSCGPINFPWFKFFLSFVFRYANERYGTELETKATKLNHNSHTLQHSQKYSEWRFRLAVNYESDIRNEAKRKGGSTVTEAIQVSRNWKINWCKPVWRLVSRIEKMTNLAKARRPFSSIFPSSQKA